MQLFHPNQDTFDPLDDDCPENEESGPLASNNNNKTHVKTLFRQATYRSPSFLRKACKEARVNTFIVRAFGMKCKFAHSDGDEIPEIPQLLFRARDADPTCFVQFDYAETIRPEKMHECNNYASIPVGGNGKPREPVTMLCRISDTDHIKQQFGDKVDVKHMVIYPEAQILNSNFEQTPTYGTVNITPSIIAPAPGNLEEDESSEDASYNGNFNVGHVKIYSSHVHAAKSFSKSPMNNCSTVKNAKDRKKILGAIMASNREFSSSVRIEGTFIMPQLNIDDYRGDWTSWFDYCFSAVFQVWRGLEYICIPNTLINNVQEDMIDYVASAAIPKHMKVYHKQAKTIMSSVQRNVVSILHSASGIASDRSQRLIGKLAVTSAHSFSFHFGKLRTYCSCVFVTSSHFIQGQHSDQIAATMKCQSCVFYVECCSISSVI